MLEGVCLCLSVVAMSSGGVWFALMGDAPSVRMASWRLLFTALLQFPMFLRQLHDADAELRLRLTRRVVLHLAAAGALLGLHFGSWSWGVGHTSLTHSLLFVSSAPLLIVTDRFARAAWGRKGGNTHHIELTDIDAPAPTTTTTTTLPPYPSYMECGGTVLGFGAIVVLMVVGGKGGGGRVTWQGDASSFLGAIAIWIYLDIGAAFRKWLPTFLFAFPVTLCAAAATYLASVAVMQEPISANFWDHPKWALYSSCAAITAGIMGHTLMSFAQSKISSLVISVAMLTEPVTGSFMGWAAGVESVPSLVTLAVGPVLLGALLLLILGERKTQ